ncbi:MAG: hypothetical protein JNJ77_21910 [Planctomycetia bacterium]|nr:hypothetical protein [Planctomycetia bacterium]
MPSRATGLNEQIDELDQLLDKLLKLPIDSARSAPSVIPINSSLSTEKSQSDQRVILKITEDDPEELQTDLPTNNSGSPSLDVIQTLSAHQDPKPEAALSIEIPPVTPTLRTEEIPWLEDEPLPSNPGNGPKIEIIQGSYSQEVVPEPTVSAISSIKPNRSWLFYLLWNITWLFDSTFGYWMPILRRPGIKFLLGLIGVSLCVVSAYLAWINWLR